MIHRTKKIKFKKGQDSNTMIMRKLMYNFLRFSHVKTTEHRAKAMKMYLERILTKAKEKTEANKNYLLRYFQQKNVMKVLFEQVGPAIAPFQGGYVKIIRLNQRMNDAAMMVELQWAHPVVLDWGDKKVVKEKDPKATSEKEKPAKPAKKEVKPKKEAKKTDTK
jgi:large subunit ribosomal protein L17